jgi:hypothetical protein
MPCGQRQNLGITLEGREEIVGFLSGLVAQVTVYPGTEIAEARVAAERLAESGPMPCARAPSR